MLGQPPLNGSALKGVTFDDGHGVVHALRGDGALEVRRRLGVGALGRALALEVVKLRLGRLELVGHISELGAQGCRGRLRLACGLDGAWALGGRACERPLHVADELSFGRLNACKVSRASNTANAKTATRADCGAGVCGGRRRLA